MKFIYEFYDTNSANNGWIKNGSTRDLNQINDTHVTAPKHVKIYSEINPCKLHKILFSSDDLEDWRIARERAAVWRSEPEVLTVSNEEIKIATTENSAVKPAHYTNFVDNYQWLDVMSRIPRYEDSEKFKSAVELQIRKYLDRNGRKDDEYQELMKGLFYYLYLVMYIKNNNKPIFASDIHKIMEPLRDN